MKPLPGHAEEIIGRGDFDSPLLVHWDCSYRTINSLQDSIRVKSLLQLVSNIAFTPRDLKSVVSFLKTWHKYKLIIFKHMQMLCNTSFFSTLPKVGKTNAVDYPTRTPKKLYVVQEKNDGSNSYITHIRWEDICRQQTINMKMPTPNQPEVKKVHNEQRERP